jgi:undecaprenyl-diphosphatase
VSATAAPARVSHLARWRGRTFGPASEQPYRRRTNDCLILVFASLVVALLAWHRNDVTRTEKDVLAFFHDLPSWMNSVFKGLYLLGTLWALAIIVVAALVARRWRLARDLLIAGVLAWVLARLMGALVVQNAGVTKSLDIATHVGNSSPNYPEVRLAVIVAVVSTAAPYLTRPMRRLGGVFVLFMTFAALYLGLATTDAALTGLFLGWGVAALVHVVFGSPGGRPTRWQVAAALDELRVPAQDVELSKEQHPRATLMEARDDNGPLNVRILGRDEADAQYAAKFWRSVLYKQEGATVHRTRLEDVEHEAYSVLLAKEAGARVPTIVVAGTAGPGAALIVERPLEGPRLAEANPSAVTDSVLDDLWQQVLYLHAARLAHGRLNAHHIVLTPDGPAVVDFEHSSTTASMTLQTQDVVELLYSTASIVGNNRAIAALTRSLPKNTVVEALPVFQVAALSTELRAHRRHAKKEVATRISDLRAGIAHALNVEEPPVQELYRVNAQQLLMAVGTLIAVFALLSQVGNPQEFWDTIKSADWGLLTVALVISFLTNFATAISLMGCVPGRLPLVRTAELQLSMSFSNLAVPAVGGLAAQIRFLQKQGTDLADAVAAGGLLAQFANIAVSLILFVVAILLSPTTISLGNIPTSNIISVVLIIVLVVGVGVALIFGVPLLRRKVLPPIESGAKTIWEAFRSPRRVLLLVVGNLANTIMYGFVMLTCVAAFGGNIDFWTVLALNIGVSTIASLVPIPGGGTAVGSIGMSGALTAVGVPTSIAVAAVLANQLVANFIPAVPGWFATNNLLHDDYL